MSLEGKDEGEIETDTPDGFWSKYQALDYLGRNYSTIDYEHHFICQAHYDFIQRIDATDSVLELGGGPTVYPLIPRRRRFNNNYLADYNLVNLDEVSRWLTGDTIAHDWTQYFEIFRELELCEKSIDKMHEEVRQDPYTKLFCNLHSAVPLPDMPGAQFDLISTNFCPESITTCYRMYCTSLTRIAQMIKPQGYLLMLLLREGNYWMLNNKRINCLWVNEDMIIELLTSRGLEIVELRSSRDPIDEHSREAFGDIEIANKDNYTGMIAVLARKKADSRL